MRLSGSSVVDGSWKTACWLGHVTTSNTVLIIPKPIEFGEGERSVEVLDVVSNIEDETSFITAVLHAAQASSDHLKVEIRAEHWPSNDDDAGLGCVESLAKYVVVHESLDLSSPEIVHCPSSRAGFRVFDHGS